MPLYKSPDKSRQATVVVACDGKPADLRLSGTSMQTTLNTSLNTAAPGTLYFFRYGTYVFSDKMLSPSGITFDCEPGTVLQMGAGQNHTVFGNKNTSTGDSNIVFRNFIIDQQGATQSAGGGMSFVGLRDSVIENVTVRESFTYNLLISSVAGTLLTGTLTFTSSDSTVTGSGTAFTTELEVGSIIKSAGNHFQRVRSITSNTSLELDRAWGWTTESGVTARLVPANARNRILNNKFEGNGDDDNVGFGLFDDSLVQGNISHDAAGYGIGLDHCNRVKIDNNTCYNVGNAGIGLETSGYCTVSNNNLHSNATNIVVQSGSWRNTVIGNQCQYSTNYGISVTYNTTSFPFPDENEIIGNRVEGAALHGIRIGGAQKTSVIANHSFNHGLAGITTATDTSRTPDYNTFQANYCYDSQDTKTQTYGFLISSGTGNRLFSNIARAADHLTGSYSDSGTATIINQTLDTNGNIALGYTATASAVNYVKVINSAASGTTSVSVDGSDANPTFRFLGRGTGLMLIEPGSNSTNALRLRSAGGTNTGIHYDSSNNRVALGGLTPLTTVDIAADSVRVRNSKTPASATATGIQGEIAWDANYIYVCTATNTWVRAALSTW